MAAKVGLGEQISGQGEVVHRSDPAGWPAAVEPGHNPGMSLAWYDALADLLWGSACPGCDRPSASVCAACREEIRPSTRPLDPWIDHRAWPGFADAPALATGRYDTALGAIIAAVKDGGRHDLLRFLEGHAAHVAAALPSAPAHHLVVPVPSHPRSVRRRGVDVTYRLARAVASQTGGTARRLLRHTRRVEDQSGLRAQQRAANVRGAFRVSGRVRPGTRVVLVDDIVTTGSTVQACAAALAAAGLRPHAAVFVAITPPPGTPAFSPTPEVR